MRKSNFKPVLCSLVTTISLLGIMVTNAIALDLTGTWKGKWTCTGFDGESYKEIVNVTYAITQVGNNLSMYENMYGCYFNGLLIEDLYSPDQKGQIIFIDCNTNTSLTTVEANNEWSEMGRARVTIRGRKAVSLWNSVTGGRDVGLGYSYVETCQGKLIRVDIDDPGVVSPCPPL
jgi:hypothetical protein